MEEEGKRDHQHYEYNVQYQQQLQSQYGQQVMAYGYQSPHPMQHDWNEMQYAPMGYSLHPQQHAAYQHHPQQHPTMYGYQYPVQQMEGVPLPLPPGIPGLGGSTDPLEAVLGPFPCVRLRNLPPYDTSLEDILLLFQGLVVIDVILTGNGEAFVIFANPMDFQMALQRDRQPIGRQFVEISSASRDQYYAAIAKQHMQEQEGGRLVASSVGSSSLGRDEGIGEGQLEQAGSAAASGVLWSGATGSSNPSVLQSIGGSPVYEPLAHSQQQLSQQQQIGSSQPQQQLTPTSSLVLSGRATSGSSARSASLAPGQKRSGGGIQVGDHTGFLRMRGLPFTSSKEDIFHFFEGYSPVQESIVLTYRNDGRATGEAYIGFATPEDAKRAMELHRRMMGNRYIELFISNKEEQGRALARFGNR